MVSIMFITYVELNLLFKAAKLAKKSNSGKNPLLKKLTNDC